MQPGQPLPYLGYLDSLRGIAILGVLATHVAAITSQTSFMARPLFRGTNGVELFYMVSAFTLFLSLDARTQEHHPKVNFFIRRFFRIAPMFYLSILLNIARLRFGFVHGRRPATFEYVLGFLFLFGFAPSMINAIVVGGWSIAVETTFYAILPLLHRLIRSWHSALIAFGGAFVVLTPLSLYLAHVGRADIEKVEYFAVVWFPMQLPVFLFGIVLYFIWKGRLQRTFAYAKLVSGILVALPVLATFLQPVESHGYLPGDVFLVGMFFLGVLIYPLRLLVNPATRYLGKISYSFYLLHFFVVETVPKAWTVLTHRPGNFAGLAYGHLPSFLAMYVVALAITVPICVLSFHWIEQPGIRLGRRLIAKLEHRAVTRAQLAMPALGSALDTPDAQV